MVGASAHVLEKGHVEKQGMSTVHLAKDNCVGTPNTSST